MLEKPTKAKTKKPKKKPVPIKGIANKFRAEQLKLVRKYSAKFTAASALYAELVVLAELHDQLDSGHVIQPSVVSMLDAVGKAIAERLNAVGAILLSGLDEANVRTPKEFKR